MNTFLKTQKDIEKGVVAGYKKIERSVVAGYKKIENRFTDAFLRPDHETTNNNNNAKGEFVMKENNFIGYEYKEITVRRETETLFTDSYGNFGWKLDGVNPSLSLTSVNLKFKRDRKIPNKVELTRLQREFEAHVKEIERLENSKTITSSTAAYIIGLVGTALMAGATFSYLAGMIPLCVILAVPGFVAWGVSYLAYLRIKKNKTEKVTPMIDREYDTIYEVCEKASNLIYA